MIRYTLLLMLVFSTPVFAGEYYVSPTGDDNNPGTKQDPFQSIGKAVEIMRPGDLCNVRKGTYRESIHLRHSGTPGKPIQLISYKNEKVVLNGTDPIKGPWSVYQGRIYQLKVEEEVGQLFLDGQMILEARWPNMRFPEELWSCSKWANAGIGSRHMRVVDPALAQTGIDWTHATAVLNVAHQFFTWTRRVKNHKKGSDTFAYDSVGDFSWRKGKDWETGKVFEDDRYYLIGKLEALDNPGEWFYDTDKKLLYVWLPEGDHPSKHRIEGKRRNFCLTGENVSHWQVRGIDLFATAFNLPSCSHFIIEDCRLLYPSHGVQVMTDRSTIAGRMMVSGSGAILTGDHNVVRKCLFAFGSLSGLSVQGNANLIENSIFHDFSWDVSLTHKPLMVRNPSSDQNSQGNIIRCNTIYNSGAPCVQFHGYNNIVEYNHVHHGLMSRCGGSKDGSLVYTQRRDCRGTIIRYNWVHDAIPELVPASWGGGIGIRGDDRTRGLTVHHNVVWNIGGAGIVVKGDENKIYNNTIFDIGRGDRPVGNYIQLLTGEEPKKPHHHDDDTRLLQANKNSLVFSNAAHTITGSWSGKLFPEDERMFHNYRGLELGLEDIEHNDFRPKAGSPLIDGGKVLPGLTDEYLGNAPDIGAYEYAGEKWIPGAILLPKDPHR